MHRIEVGTGARHDVFGADALERLWVYHSTAADGNLRKTLQIAHTAVAEAGKVDADYIGFNAIEAAIPAWR